MRIIAGEFRGRRLTAPKGLETRPTTDRVREAWFSMLGHPGALAVDLFAGTGALGFEALSRGAEHVFFVEKARPAVAAIRKNAASLGVDARVTVIESDVTRVGGVLLREGPFDLVLADPPWTALEQSERALQAVLSPALFKPDGVLVLGHPKGRPIVPSSLSAWRIDKSRTWGDSAATFFRLAEG